MKVIHTGKTTREEVTESLKRTEGENDAANKCSGDDGFIIVVCLTAYVLTENVCKRHDWVAQAVIHSWSHFQRYRAQLLHQPGAAKTADTDVGSVTGAEMLLAMLTRSTTRGHG